MITHAHYYHTYTRRKSAFKLNASQLTDTLTTVQYNARIKKPLMKTPVSNAGIKAVKVIMSPPD